MMRATTYLFVCALALQGVLNEELNSAASEDLTTVDKASVATARDIATSSEPPVIEDEEATSSEPPVIEDEEATSSEPPVIEDEEAKKMSWNENSETRVIK
uniref:Putative secreted protein n=1 Tax=Ixodes ricinus TaxID=34613 RepID=A0A6B0U8T5_IXORI